MWYIHSNQIKKTREIICKTKTFNDTKYKNICFFLRVLQIKKLSLSTLKVSDNSLSTLVNSSMGVLSSNFHFTPTPPRRLHPQFRMHFVYSYCLYLMYVKYSGYWLESSCPSFNVFATFNALTQPARLKVIDYNYPTNLRGYTVFSLLLSTLSLWIFNDVFLRCKRTSRAFDK